MTTSGIDNFHSVQFTQCGINTGDYATTHGQNKHDKSLTYICSKLEILAVWPISDKNILDRNQNNRRKECLFGGNRVFNPHLWTKFDTQSEEKWEEDSSDDKHAGFSGLMTKSPRSVCNQLFSLNQATTISFLSKYILRRVKSSRLPFSRNSLQENTRNK